MGHHHVFSASHPPPLLLLKKRHLPHQHGKLSSIKRPEHNMGGFLDHWKKDWTLLQYLFDKPEIEIIKTRLKNLKIETLVYCSFENRFARSGGLAAVTAKILPYLKAVNNIPTTILMTPLHSRIIDESRLKSTGIVLEVPFGRKRVKTEIFEYRCRYEVPQRVVIKEYFLKAEGFFRARNRLNDPYIFFENDVARNNDAIRENALFFCRAIPLAAQQLGLRKNIVFHLQEWQTAPVAVTAKLAMVNGILHSCATVQTMHNPFDSFLPWQSLRKIVGPKRVRSIAAHFEGGLTAYQLALQLVDAPITTVSENFAREFTTDILQTRHFAPHLQSIFKRTGVVGINNGLFSDFPPQFSDLKQLTIGQIRKLKTQTRHKLLKILADYQPPERFGELTYNGGTIQNLPDAVPIFVMSGRLDFNQKGFDIFLQAMERFAEDEIKVVLAPMPIKLGQLEFFRQTAARCRGNVTVFPIKMKQGYHELQIGATFGVMPSIYEPFGAAIEYMVNGTVNIARRTGGLVDQIDHRRCGLLYRENSAFYNLKNIKRFFDCRDDVAKRKDNQWAQSMVDGLYETLIDATDLYRNHPNEYYRLILMGFKKALSFDWSVSARKYFQIYEMVSQGF